MTSSANVKAIFAQLSGLLEREASNDAEELLACAAEALAWHQVCQTLAPALIVLLSAHFVQSGGFPEALQVCCTSTGKAASILEAANSSTDQWEALARAGQLYSQLVDMLLPVPHKGPAPGIACSARALGTDALAGCLRVALKMKQHAACSPAQETVLRPVINTSAVRLRALQPTHPLLLALPGEGGGGADAWEEQAAVESPNPAHVLVPAISAVLASLQLPPMLPGRRLPFVEARITLPAAATHPTRDLATALVQAAASTWSAVQASQVLAAHAHGLAGGGTVHVTVPQGASPLSPLDVQCVFVEKFQAAPTAIQSLAFDSPSAAASSAAALTPPRSAGGGAHPPPQRAAAAAVGATLTPRDPPPSHLVMQLPVHPRYVPEHLGEGDAPGEEGLLAALAVQLHPWEVQPTPQPHVPGAAHLQVPAMPWADAPDSLMVPAEGEGQASDAEQGGGDNSDDSPLARERPSSSDPPAAEQVDATQQVEQLLQSVFGVRPQSQNGRVQVQVAALHVAVRQVLASAAMGVLPRGQLPNFTVDMSGVDALQSLVGASSALDRVFMNGRGDQVHRCLVQLTARASHDAHSGALATAHLHQVHAWVSASAQSVALCMACCAPLARAQAAAAPLMARHATERPAETIKRLAAAADSASAPVELVAYLRASSCLPQLARVRRLLQAHPQQCCLATVQAAAQQEGGLQPTAAAGSAFAHVALLHRAEWLSALGSAAAGDVHALRGSLHMVSRTAEALATHLAGSSSTLDAGGAVAAVLSPRAALQVLAVADAAPPLDRALRACTQRWQLTLLLRSAAAVMGVNDRSAQWLASAQPSLPSSLAAACSVGRAAGGVRVATLPLSRLEASARTGGATVQTVNKCISADFLRSLQTPGCRPALRLQLQQLWSGLVQGQLLGNVAVHTAIQLTASTVNGEPLVVESNHMVAHLYPPQVLGGVAVLSPAYASATLGMSPAPVQLRRSIDIKTLSTQATASRAVASGLDAGAFAWGCSDALAVSGRSSGGDSAPLQPLQDPTVGVPQATHEAAWGPALASLAGARCSSALSSGRRVPWHDLQLRGVQAGEAATNCLPSRKADLRTLLRLLQERGAHASVVASLAQGLVLPQLQGSRGDLLTPLLRALACAQPGLERGFVAAVAGPIAHAALHTAVCDMQQLGAAVTAASRCLAGVQVGSTDVAALQTAVILSAHDACLTAGPALQRVQAAAAATAASPLLAVAAADLAVCISAWGESLAQLAAASQLLLDVLSACAFQYSCPVLSGSTVLHRLAACIGSLPLWRGLVQAAQDFMHKCTVAADATGSDVWRMPDTLMATALQSTMAAVDALLRAPQALGRAEMCLIHKVAALAMDMQLPDAAAAAACLALRGATPLLLALLAAPGARCHVPPAQLPCAAGGARQSTQALAVAMAALQGPLALPLGYWQTALLSSAAALCARSPFRLDEAFGGKGGSLCMDAIRAFMQAAWNSTSTQPYAAPNDLTAPCAFLPLSPPLQLPWGGAPGWMTPQHVAAMQGSPAAGDLAVQDMKVVLPGRVHSGALGSRGIESVLGGLFQVAQLHSAAAAAASAAGLTTPRRRRKAGILPSPSAAGHLLPWYALGNIRGFGGVQETRCLPRQHSGPGAARGMLSPVPPLDMGEEGGVGDVLALQSVLDTAAACGRLQAMAKQIAPPPGHNSGGSQEGTWAWLLSDIAAATIALRSATLKLASEAGSVALATAAAAGSTHPQRLQDALLLLTPDARFHVAQSGLLLKLHGFSRSCRRGALWPAAVVGGELPPPQGDELGQLLGLQAALTAAMVCRSITLHGGVEGGAAALGRHCHALAVLSSQAAGAGLGSPQMVPAATARAMLHAAATLWDSAQRLLLCVDAPDVAALEACTALCLGGVPVPPEGGDPAAALLCFALVFYSVTMRLMHFEQTQQMPPAAEGLLSGAQLVQACTLAEGGAPLPAACGTPLPYCVVYECLPQQLPGALLCDTVVVSALGLWAHMLPGAPALPTALHSIRQGMQQAVAAAQHLQQQEALRALVRVPHLWLQRTRAPEFSVRVPPAAEGALEEAVAVCPLPGHLPSVSQPLHTPSMPRGFVLHSGAETHERVYRRTLAVFLVKQLSQQLQAAPTAVQQELLPILHQNLMTVVGSVSADATASAADASDALAATWGRLNLERESLFQAESPQQWLNVPADSVLLPQGAAGISGHPSPACVADALWCAAAEGVQGGALWETHSSLQLLSPHRNMDTISSLAGFWHMDQWPESALKSAELAWAGALGLRGVSRTARSSVLPRSGGTQLLHHTTLLPLQGGEGGLVRHSMMQASFRPLLSAAQLLQWGHAQQLRALLRRGDCTPHTVMASVFHISEAVHAGRALVAPTDCRAVARVPTTALVHTPAAEAVVPSWNSIQPLDPQVQSSAWRFTHGAEVMDDLVVLQPALQRILGQLGTLTGGGFTPAATPTSTAPAALFSMLQSIDAPAPAAAPTAVQGNTVQLLHALQLVCRGAPLPVAAEALLDLAEGSSAESLQCRALVLGAVAALAGRLGEAGSMGRLAPAWAAHAQGGGAHAQGEVEFSFASDSQVEAQGLNFTPEFVRAHAECPPLPSEGDVASAAEESVAVLQNYAQALREREADVAAQRAAAVAATAAARHKAGGLASAARSAATAPGTPGHTSVPAHPAAAPPLPPGSAPLLQASTLVASAEAGTPVVGEGGAASAPAALGMPPPPAAASADAQLKSAQREADAASKEATRLHSVQEATSHAAHWVESQSVLAHRSSMPVTLHKVHMLRCALAYLDGASSAHLPSRALALWGAFHALQDAYVAREEEVDGPAHLAAMHEGSWMHHPGVCVPLGTAHEAPETWHVHVTHLFSRCAWLAGESALRACVQLRGGGLEPRSRRCLDTVSILHAVEIALTLYSVMRDTPLCVPDHATAPAVAARPRDVPPLTALALGYGRGVLGVLGDSRVTHPQESAWRTRTHVLLGCLRHCASVVRLLCHRHASAQVTFDAWPVEQALLLAGDAMTESVSPDALRCLVEAAQHLSSTPAWGQSLWVLPPALWHVAQLIARCLRQMAHLIARAPQASAVQLGEELPRASCALQVAALRAMHCSWLLGAVHNTRGRKGRSTQSQAEQLWEVRTVASGQGGVLGVAGAQVPPPPARLAVHLTASRSSAVSKSAAVALLEAAYRVTAAHCKALQAAAAAVCAAAGQGPSPEQQQAARVACETAHTLQLVTPAAAAGGSVASPLPSPATPPSTPVVTQGAAAEAAPVSHKALTSVWAGTVESPPPGICHIGAPVLISGGSDRFLLCAPCTLPDGHTLVLPVSAICDGRHALVTALNALHTAVLCAFDNSPATPVSAPMPPQGLEPPCPPLMALTVLTEVLSALHACKYLLGPSGTEARLLRKQMQLLALLPGLQDTACACIELQPALQTDAAPGSKRPRDDDSTPDHAAKVPRLSVAAGVHAGGGQGAEPPPPAMLCLPPGLQSMLQPMEGVLNSQKSLRNNQLVSVWHAEPPSRSRDWHLTAALASLHLPAHSPSDALAYAGSEEPLSSSVPDCYVHLDRRMRTFEARRCLALHSVTALLAGLLDVPGLAWPWRPYAQLPRPCMQQQQVAAAEMLVDVGTRLVAPQEGATCVTLPASARVLALLCALLASQQAAQVWSQRGGAYVPPDAAGRAAAVHSALPAALLQRMAALVAQLAKGPVLALGKQAGRHAAGDSLVKCSPEAAGVLLELVHQVALLSPASSISSSA